MKSSLSWRFSNTLRPTRLVGQFTVAYGVLDAMNNAGNNMYVMFIDPDWDPGECPLLDFD